MKYKKKPVEVEAIQWNGLNVREVENFTNDCVSKCSSFEYKGDKLNIELIIYTLEGDMKANKGDYIIKGIKGEFYPCKPDIFEKTYEKVEE